MILIKQAQIVDGSGKKSYRADVLIDGQKISAIGNFANKKADVVIDAVGATVAPGFIDLHTHSDHYLSLFTYPSQKDFLLQGVTTIVGGHDGVSLAPLLYGSLHSLRRWAHTEGVNVDWHTVEELRKVLQRLSFGVNFATLIGYSTIRQALIGDEIRDLTDSEWAVARELLSQGLQQGGRGISVNTTWPAEQVMSYRERLQCAETAAQLNKPYISDIRNTTDTIAQSWQELIQLAQEASGKVLLSHALPRQGFQKAFQEAQELFEKSLVRANVYVGVNPLPLRCVAIDELLPVAYRQENIESVLAMSDDLKVVQAVHQSLVKVPLDEYVVLDARGQNSIAGKTLKELAENRGKSPEAIVWDLMQGTQMRTIFGVPDVDPAVVDSLLFHNRALIGSFSMSVSERTNPYKSPFNAAFPRFLEKAVEKQIPVEDAIQQITSRPAEFLGIKNRGLLKEGYYADITVLRDNKIVTDVLVNGRVAVRDKAWTGEIAGVVL